MAELFANNAETVVARQIDFADNQIILSDASDFPTPVGGDFFYLTLQYGYTIEIVKCTGRDGNVLDVERAQQGTVATAFPTGSEAEIRLTKATIEDAWVALADAVTKSGEQTVTGLKHFIGGMTIPGGVGGDVDFSGNVDFAGKVSINDSNDVESATTPMVQGVAGVTVNRLSILDGSDATPSTNAGPMVFFSQRGDGSGWSNGPSSAYGMVTLKLASKAGITLAPMWTQTGPQDYWQGGSTAFYSRTYQGSGSEDTAFDSSFGFASDIQKFYPAASSGGEVNYQNYSGRDDGVTYQGAVAELNMTCGLAIVGLGSKHLTTGIYLGTQTPSTGRHWSAFEVGTDSIVEDGGCLGTLTLTDRGTGFTSEPAVTATGLTGCTIGARINGIDSVTIDTAGTGYPANAVIPMTANGGGGSGFFANALTDGAGAITSVVVKRRGRNYTSAPTMVLNSKYTGAGSGATFTPVLGSGKISYLYIVSRGHTATTYTPTIGFAGGGGAGATASATAYIPSAFLNRSSVPSLVSQHTQPLLWQMVDGSYRGSFMVDSIGSSFINATNIAYFTKDGTTLGGLGTVSGAHVVGSTGAFHGKRFVQEPNISLIAASSAIASTAAATYFNKTITLPAGVANVAGARIIIKASGKYNTVAGVDEQVAIRVDLGGGTVFYANHFAGNGVTDYGWSLEAEAVVRTTGATAAVIGGAGISSMAQRADTRGNYFTINTFTVDLTTAKDIKVEWDWLNANASNTVTMNTFTVEVVFPNSTVS